MEAIKLRVVTMSFELECIYVCLHRSIIGWSKRRLNNTIFGLSKLWILSQGNLHNARNVEFEENP